MNSISNAVKGDLHRLDDQHLEAILAHEVAHMHRRDNLAASIHMDVEAIFWFHPFVESTDDGVTWTITEPISASTQGIWRNESQG